MCTLGSHTFAPISWNCKKQKAVSNSSTEAEIISSDAGLRLEEIPALSSWHTVTVVLARTAGRNPMRNNKPKKTKSLMADKRVTDSIDFVPPNVPPNAHLSSQRASVFVF